MPTTLSTSIDLVEKSASDNVGEKSSAVAVVLFSIAPKELLDTPITLTSVLIVVCAKPLLLKTVLFTLKGDVLSGAVTTLGA